VKLLLSALGLSAALSLCACTATPLPTTPTAVITADAMLALDGFQPDFYRAFVQNGYESPDHLEAIHVLQSPFRVYLKTVDDAGRAIDKTTLDTTERALTESALIWSGGTFGILETVRGSSTRENVPGWITVKWNEAAATGRCGRSTIGVDGGFIELNATGECSCGMATRVYPRVVRHELGHAMGYYHTGDKSDVMYGKTITSDACDVLPSERERLHAKVAHSRLQ